MQQQFASVFINAATRQMLLHKSILTNYAPLLRHHSKIILIELNMHSYIYTCIYLQYIYVCVYMRIYYLCSKSRAQAQSMPKKVCNENCIRSVILTVFVEGLTDITEEQ